MKIFSFFGCFLRLLDKLLRKKYDNHPEVPDYIPHPDEMIYVSADELNDLLDASSNSWDELLSLPHVLENNRARLEYAYNISESDYDNPLY